MVSGSGRGVNVIVVPVAVVAVVPLPPLAAVTVRSVVNVAVPSALS
jgi:hypothetical protein